MPRNSQSEWVSAGRTRCWRMGDPILDWLGLYGKQKGFASDDELPTYDPRTDFTAFVFDKGSGFERAVLDCLSTRAPIATVACDYRDALKPEALAQTRALMCAGAPIIYQAPLADDHTHTHGIADLLVRSDVLNVLVPGTISEAEACVEAPSLAAGPWHYRVVDVKFTTLHLLGGGGLANAGSAPGYKSQVAIYNRALGRLQGYTPPLGYLLGRGWEQAIKGQTSRCDTCLDRLAPIEATDAMLLAETDAACHWVRRVRREGQDWDALPEPSLEELYPNMTNAEDGPWHAAKKQIADGLGELTLLWQVGLEKRRGAHANGLRCWRDAACTPQAVGIKGDKQAPILAALLAINQTDDGPPVRPAYVYAERDAWHPTPELEFYVDFETVTDLYDDFTKMPQKGGQPMIFMVGCGHVDNGQWRFQCFTADRLNEDEETRVIEEWLSHMEEVHQRLAPHLSSPLVIHWSSAEISFLETAYNSACRRHPERNWPTPNWFDFLKRVVRAEPVVVRGALGFGLKALAKAMHRYGLIDTVWEDGPTDGLGAMVAAWWCEEQRQKLGAACPEADKLMAEVALYNEIDCRVMMEIVRHLRQEH